MITPDFKKEVKLDLIYTVQATERSKDLNVYAKPFQPVSRVPEENENWINKMTPIERLLEVFQSIITEMPFFKVLAHQLYNSPINFQEPLTRIKPSSIKNFNDDMNLPPRIIRERYIRKMSYSQN
jgi:hypothetical protein